MLFGIYRKRNGKTTKKLLMLTDAKNMQDAADKYSDKHGNRYGIIVTVYKMKLKNKVSGATSRMTRRNKKIRRISDPLMDAVWG